MITILYFGQLKDQLGLTQETLAWAGGSTTQLLQQLRERDDTWAIALAPGKVFRLVINQQIQLGEAIIPDNAEVGILPPVTGG